MERQDRAEGVKGNEETVRRLFVSRCLSKGDDGYMGKQTIVSTFDDKFNTGGSRWRKPLDSTLPHENNHFLFVFAKTSEEAQIVLPTHSNYFNINISIRKNNVV